MGGRSMNLMRRELKERRHRLPVRALRLEESHEERIERGLYRIWIAWHDARNLMRRELKVLF